MNNFINLLSRALFMSTPLILGAVGEVISERAGMMMCAVEGVFLTGAWGGFIGTYLSGSLLTGFLCAMLCGMLVALLYGVTTIYMNQHQIVMGTAVAILMTGFCTFFYRVILLFYRDIFYFKESSKESFPTFMVSFKVSFVVVNPF